MDSLGGGGGSSHAHTVVFGGGKNAGVPNTAALARAAVTKKRLDAGFLGREAEVGLHLSFAAPPFWSTAKHGMPVTNGGGDVGAGSGGHKATAPAGAMKQKFEDIRSRLSDPDSRKMSNVERVKLIAQLPPHDQIVCLARGMDRPVATQNWTNDTNARFQNETGSCLRRAIGSVELLMKVSLAKKVKLENGKSAAPAFTEKYFLMNVFQHVDRTKHGVVTGECDLELFAKAWGVSLKREKKIARTVMDDEDVDDVLREDDDNDFADDAEVVHDENADGNVTEAANPSTHTKPPPKSATVKFAPNVATRPLVRRRAKDGVFECVELIDDASDESPKIGITRNSIAALFVKYGYDVGGFMPYEVFVSALLAAPSRLRGMELSMDTGAKHGFSPNDDPRFEGKILHPKCRTPVSPPSGFDPALVRRSACAPEATLELEHAYGYAGSQNTSSNLFYLSTGEVVYHAASLGIVLDKDASEKKKPCQRFFFGHDETITCMAVHPNREWVASGQAGATPFFCVWDAITMLQLQKIRHPNGTRCIGAGIAALAFSFHDGGDTITSVTADKTHTVSVWRWSKGGDAGALERAKYPAAWRFGPKKNENALEFFVPDAGGKKQGEKPPKLDGKDLATSAFGGRGGAPPGNGGSKGTSHDNTYSLVGRGVGQAGLPPMVNGIQWNPFPNSNEFVTFGVKHMKVWRPVVSMDGYESNAGSNTTQWVGELSFRNDGKRVADCGFKTPRFRNTGEPGGGFVLPPTPDPEEDEDEHALGEFEANTHSVSRSVADESFADGRESPAPSGEQSVRSVTREKGKTELNISMTSLSSLRNHREASASGDNGANTGSIKQPSLSASVRASFAKRNTETDFGRFNSSNSKTKSEGSAENVLAAAYARRDVVVTGFPDGGLGVWKVEHRDIHGTLLDTGVDENFNKVARWSCSLVQRISDAHKPGPRRSLNDGTSTFGGVRCVELRGDGRTMLTGGADGWIHVWSVCDGQISVIADPKDTGARGDQRLHQRLKKVKAVLLNRVCRDLTLAEETAGNSWRFKSPYAGEPSPAVTSLDPRPVDVPGTGKKRVATKDKGVTPDDFLIGTDAGDVLEVEHRDDSVEVTTQVHGHLADVAAMATHPRDANVFASTADTRVFLWNTCDRNLTRTSGAGGVCGSSVAFSADPVPKTNFKGWQPFHMKRMGTSSKFKMEKAQSGHQLAVGGKHGGLAVLDGVTLQPLLLLKPGKNAPKTSVDTLKFCGGPRQMLACGSHDLVVDIHDVGQGYTRLHRLVGHQAAIVSLDWSLPVGDTGTRVLQTTCALHELLFWDAVAGKQVVGNTRDAKFETYTSTRGFPVMGIWPEGSDAHDVNALDAASVGQPCLDGDGENNQPTTRPGDRDVRSAGFCVTSDATGTVKLFNYPCVANDAPYRAYKGHASRAVSVRFTAGNDRLITAGSFDRTVLQFATKGVRVGEQKTPTELPAKETREWGPIDGGKAFGWITPEVDPNSREDPVKRCAPAKPEPKIVLAPDE